LASRCGWRSALAWASRSGRAGGRSSRQHKTGGTKKGRVRRPALFFGPLRGVPEYVRVRVDGSRGVARVDGRGARPEGGGLGRTQLARGPRGGRETRQRGAALL